jgi:hypothetical protein
MITTTTNQCEQNGCRPHGQLGLARVDVNFFGGRFYMARVAVGSRRGALKSVQTVSLRSLPVARLAAGTLAFHGLIRSRLGRLGAWPRACRTLVSIRRCSDQTAATTNVNGRHSLHEGAGMMEHGGQKFVADENDGHSYPRNPSIHQLKCKSAEVPFKSNFQT